MKDQIEQQIDKLVEAKASGVTLEEIIKIHVKASGPVSFQSIWRYAQVQYDNEIDNYQVAAEMNIMLRKGIIELYDDGETFV